MFNQRLTDLSTEFKKHFTCFELLKKKNIICTKVGQFTNEIVRVSGSFTPWAFTKDQLFALYPLEQQ